MQGAPQRVEIWIVIVVSIALALYYGLITLLPFIQDITYPQAIGQLYLPGALISVGYAIGVVGLLRRKRWSRYVYDFVVYVSVVQVLMSFGDLLAVLRTPVDSYATLSEWADLALRLTAVWTFGLAALNAIVVYRESRPARAS